MSILRKPANKPDSCWSQTAEARVPQEKRRARSTLKKSGSVAQFCRSRELCGENGQSGGGVQNCVTVGHTVLGEGSEDWENVH